MSFQCTERLGAEMVDPRLKHVGVSDFVRVSNMFIVVEPIQSQTVWISMRDLRVDIVP